MTRLRLAIAAAMVALLTAVPAPPVGAVPILDEQDAVELANNLADAMEEQDVCYGWQVSVRDDDGPLSGLDQGSSLGPGQDPRDPACSPSVIFVADLRYTSQMSESADSASYRIDSTLPGFSGRGLADLGIDEGALLGDDDDLAVFNATSLLPALVAEKGLAPPIIAEETTGTIPAADRPTGSPSSDRVRGWWPAFTITGLLILLGGLWMAAALFLRSSPDLAAQLTASFSEDDD